MVSVAQLHCRLCLLAVTALSVRGVAADVLETVSAADRADDAAVAAIATPEELAAKQAAWRSAWIAGLGGLPARTPLDAKEGPVVKCDGFTLQNVLFESQPGVYVIGHLALPDSPAFKPPYPAVLMPMGHSDSGIIAPRYAAHLAMMARAGFAAFSWDPIGQGERRQCPAKYDATFRECAAEHTRLGFRGWLVGWNFARFRIWDGIRALDWLETRRDIDCSRVGLCGTSGGGTMSAYLQALDPRIKVAFPNCYVSSIRAVFAERGCHDAEQFFWNQLNVGVNHAAMLALGFPRVSLAIGSRWADYFPHEGAVETFAVYSNLRSRLCEKSKSGVEDESKCGVEVEERNLKTCAATPLNGGQGLTALPAGQHNKEATHHSSTLDRRSLGEGGSTQNFDLPSPAPWHFHCAGPHGLPLPTRQAQVDWMTHCIKGGPAPKPLADYWALSPGDHSGANDPSSREPLPFPTNAAFFTATHFVRDLKGFKSVYVLIGDRAKALAKARKPKTRDELREIVRRRAGIRPLDELCGAAGTPRLPETFDHQFNWWYLNGAYGVKRENEAAILATLGRSVVGRDAERIILKAISEILKAHPEVRKEELLTSSVRPSTTDLVPRIPLKAVSWDCIAAAHAYAAEPQLFSGVEFTDPPPSWTEMVTNPDPKADSFAVAVWGALEEYDWTDLVPLR